MTIDHRKADILNQMFQNDLTNLVASLAAVLEERDALKAKVADLEAKLSPKPDEPAK